MLIANAFDGFTSI